MTDNQYGRTVCEQIHDVLEPHRNRNPRRGSGIPVLFWFGRVALYKLRLTAAVPARKNRRRTTVRAGRPFITCLPENGV